ncbi:MAG: ABC transporter permease [Alphaproteobacteria bacterium]
MLGPLNKKLIRDLWAVRGQALAIAFVIAGGVATQVMSVGMLYSLQETRDAYYQRYRFADVFAPVTRAPNALVDDIARLPGVRRAEGRIAAGALIDMPGVVEPISATVISAENGGRQAINDIHLVAGRRAATGRVDEAVVSEAFANAYRLTLGTSFAAILDGARRELTVVGIALSPEYVFALGPGQFVPDDRRYGVLWMDRKTLAHAFDLDGAFNEAVLLLQPGADPTGVIDRLDRMLRRYGGGRAFAREDQISDQFLSSEMDQLTTMATVLPPVFLGVAAFLLNLVFGRLIATERGQIGLMKAFGYSDLAIGWHYLKFAFSIAGLGFLIGAGLGTWLGREMAALFLDYYRFPFLLFQAGAGTYALAVLVTMGVTALGVSHGVWRAARLAPAVAMAPPPPPDYSIAGDWLTNARRLFDQPTRMILRRLLRWPLRAGFTVTGIALAMALYIGVSFFVDSMDHMVDVTFNLMQRQDIAVSFAEPRDRRALFDLAGAPGVLVAEGFRSVPAMLRHGHRQVRQGLLGVPAEAQLNRVIDAAYRVVPPSPAGLLLSENLAEKLDVHPGDRIEVQVLAGRWPRVEQTVAAVVKTYIGDAAVLEIGALNRLMHEGPVISGLYLSVDEAARPALYATLKSTPMVAGVTLQTEAKRKFDKTLDENIGRSVFFNTLFAMLVAVGVVYNAVRVALAERERELASLRVLGFSHGEVAYILLGEVAILTLLALPLGSVMGHFLALGLSHAMSADLYRIPFVVAPSTYGWASILILSAALAAGLVAWFRLGRLDLVAVLKTRE